MHAPIQRRFTLIRHAKAVEEAAGGDHARPLNPRGLADAQALAAWLPGVGVAPQQVLCSTATRTRQTLETLGLSASVTLTDKLYLASVSEMMSLVQATPATVTDLMLIGHNPGIHGLLAHLVGEYADEADVDRLMLKFPTSAAAVLHVTLADWADLAPHSATLEFLRY